MIQNISRGRETRRARRESIWIGAFAVVLLLFAAATESMASDDNGAIGQKFQIEVLSSPPDQVSGDDSRVNIRMPRDVNADDVKIYLNGNDITDIFHRVQRSRRLEGVVSGLELGENELEVRTEQPAWQWWFSSSDPYPDPAFLTLVNHPVEGPMFSGPHQAVFLCATNGHRANAELGPVIDENCAAETVTSFK
jgi:hypothetical protein